MASSSYTLDVELGPGFRRLLWEARLISLAHFGAGFLGGLVAFAAARALGF
jgi:hypothetical protein